MIHFSVKIGLKSFHALASGNDLPKKQMKRFNKFYLIFFENLQIESIYVRVLHFRIERLTLQRTPEAFIQSHHYS
ncbi:CLUMA_CG003349, isoform A [Clunio marinus]|uniref:CLUMA_CG003349, isoform A n=1 Tax=Clunio marinus TaxID=568069 RepID=A0A1J1HNK0_9DIPT|nr:CLUMA_CG003349, isoform A [Clunio marinus]